jgi:four helix bundle protein
MQGLKKPYPKDPRQLKVYDKALQFMNNLYEVISKYPSLERFNMCDQMRRAVCSIPANLAEGQASIYYAKEYSHLDMAVGSGSEIRAFLQMSLLRNYISSEQFNYLDGEAKNIIGMIVSLMKNIERILQTAKGEGDLHDS